MTYPSLTMLKAHSNMQAANDYHVEKRMVKMLLEKSFPKVRIIKLIHQDHKLVAVKFVDLSGKHAHEHKASVGWQDGNITLLEVVNV